MPAYLTLGQATDENGHRFPVSRDNGRTAQVNFPAPLLTSTAFGQPVGALRGALAIFTQGAPLAMERLSATGWTPEAPKHLDPTRRATKGLLTDGRARKIELEARREEYLRPVRRNVTDANRAEELLRCDREAQRRAELRAYVRSLRPGEMMDLIFTNPEFAAAVVELPEASGVPAELMDRLQDHVIEWNLTNRFAVQEPKKASATNLFAVGANVEVGRERAKLAMDTLKSDVAEVASVEAVLNETIDYIAVVADVSRFAAFDMVAA